MYIEKQKIKNYEYLRLVEKKAVINKDGKKDFKKVTICNLGKLSDYDDGLPNYMERLKESLKQGKPIIKELLVYVENEQRQKEENERQEDFDIINIPFISGDKQSVITYPLKYSHIFLNHIYTELGLNDLFNEIESKANITFDFTGCVKMMVYSYMITKSSCFAIYKNNEKYFSPPINKDINENDIYNTQSIIWQNKDRIINHLHKKLKELSNFDIVYIDSKDIPFDIFLSNTKKATNQFTRKTKHIHAYLLVCYISLVMYRFIQYKIITSSDFAESNNLLQNGFSVKKIQYALDIWSVQQVSNSEYYMFINISSDLVTILKAFNVSLPVKLLKYKELKYLFTDF